MIPTLAATVLAAFVWAPQPAPPKPPPVVEIVCIDVGLPYLLCHTVTR